MAESLVAVTSGSGKNLHTFNRTIGANSVEDEVMLNGEPYLATYAVTSGASTSIATANDHVIEIMAGASLNVYIRRILVYQSVIATTAAIAQFEIRSLTTAGTGGTVLTSARLDGTDAAAGATAMSLATAKGTESLRWWLGTAVLIQTVATAGGTSLMFDINFDQLKTKQPRIPAGTANGIALKNLAAYAGASVFVTVFYSEANF